MLCFGKSLDNQFFAAKLLNAHYLEPLYHAECCCMVNVVLLHQIKIYD